ncbi:hypothetical protein [Streptomyces sp. CBMA29]|nr:hypothetical protein [Streptomyces sp. CBMA29]
MSVEDSHSHPYGIDDIANLAITPDDKNLVAVSDYSVLPAGL